ncbi:hypothetical protein [Flavobacterium sp. ASW18X]|uniref:hypothetical protein n=1 Tax=Flavobacterium sp. ASW18X TaxID=2572595 RepID=UPI0010AE833D|nr:hypothetical protein [Flavobacterium sp. ASW18X]TKD59244.1 hypothetical protein FBT53_13560 [Flavobacterium sp. ASW18X]
MKKIIPLLLVLVSLSSFAQVKIGEDITTIDASSLLELESTTKALVLTRVSNQQMNAIFPLNGALVYNTDTQCVHYFNGTAWDNLCDGTSNGPAAALTDNLDGTFTFTNASGVETTFYGEAQNISTLEATGPNEFTYTNELGEKTILALSGNSFSGSYADLTDIPTNLDTDSTDDFSGAFADLTGVPVNLDIDSTDDFSGSFNDLTNVPADIADGDDDTTYTAGAGLNLVGTEFSVNNTTITPAWANITGVPVNLDIDSTDDFSGSFNDLTNVPADIADGDDDTTYTAGAGLNLVGTEFSVNNTTITPAWANITGVPANLDTDSTDDFSGAFADLTGVPANLDIDSTDDFSGSFNDLTNVPADIADGDDDTTYTVGAGLNLVGTEFSVNNTTITPAWANITGIPANLDTDSTDDFSGAFADLTGVPVNLDIDSTDDFSGSFNDLTNVPADIADGDDDTTYTAGAGLNLVGTEFSVNNTTITPFGYPSQSRYRFHRRF